MNSKDLKTKNDYIPIIYKVFKDNKIHINSKIKLCETIINDSRFISYKHCNNQCILNSTTKIILFDFKTMNMYFHFRKEKLFHIKMLANKNFDQQYTIIEFLNKTKHKWSIIDMEITLLKIM